MPRVVVTGLGLVTPRGTDVEDVWTRLLDGEVTVLTNGGYATHTSARNLSRPGWAYVTYQGSPAGGLVVVFGVGAHEWQVDVNVGIDEPGEYEAILGVNDFGVRRDLQIFTNGGNRFAFAEDVCAKVIGGCNDSAIFYQ